MPEAPNPFVLEIPDAEIEDLRARLALTRFPDQAPEPPWTFSTDVRFMRKLIEYWRDGFNWRDAETLLNALPQHRVEIDGIDLHYLQIEGEGLASVPLLLSHGWPGSVFEFLELIPRLTHPSRFGGDPLH